MLQGGQSSGACVVEGKGYLLKLPACATDPDTEVYTDPGLKAPQERFHGSSQVSLFARGYEYQLVYRVIQQVPWFEKRSHLLRRDLFQAEIRRRRACGRIVSPDNVAEVKATKDPW